MRNPNSSFYLFAIAVLTFNFIFWNGRAHGTTDAYSNNNARPTNGLRRLEQDSRAISKNLQQPNVVICGGGPGGLLASVLLGNIGIKSTVIEQSTESTPWGSKSYTIVLNEKGKESLDRGGCLEAATMAGQERHFTAIVNPTTGAIQRIPKDPPNLAITRHLLVESIERIASACPNVTFKKGVEVSGVTSDADSNLLIELQDGTTVHGTHVIGADGKWSNVRRSFPFFSSTMVTCPSSAVHMTMAEIPSGWDSNSTYLARPMNKESKFYIIFSSLPGDSGMSLSMVYFDEMLEKHGWLEPPESFPPANFNEGWSDPPNGSTENKTTQSLETNEFANNIKALFEQEMPAIAALLHDEVYRTAARRRRATWLQMHESEGNPVTYASKDGRVSLIGDAAHAMTASIGEGCNTALESAVKLVDSVIETMKEKDEVACTAKTLSLAFTRYGSSRPRECISIQELSASRSSLTK